MKTAIEIAQEMVKRNRLMCSCHDNFIDHIQEIIDRDGENVAKSVCIILNEQHMKIITDILEENYARNNELSKRI